MKIVLSVEGHPPLTINLPADKDQQHNEFNKDEIPVEEQPQPSPQKPWYGPPELAGVVRALRAMQQTYTMTWDDRRKEYGRGSYKIRRLFREAEKAGLL